jgi:hypothetical protein
MNLNFISYLENGQRGMAIFLILLSIHGLAGFSMFIAEESMQTAMFGAFSYQDLDNGGLRLHYELVMKPVHKTSKLIIYTACFPGFLFCIPYLNYLNANAGYLKSIERRIYK